jgi:acetyl esterase/lipase
VDPELAAALPMLPELPFDDLPGTRAAFDSFFTDEDHLEREGVVIANRSFGASDGHPVEVRIFTPSGGRARKAAVLDLHGGGFAIGTTRMDDQLNVAIAREVDAVVVSVEYRLAPEHPFPTPAQDCYDALLWVWAEAEALGVDRDRIAVHGDSAGGGLAATVCLWARDLDGPNIAFQSLLEPELDDRCDTPSMLAGTDTPVWYRDNALLSWQYYLSGQEPSPYAAPARMADLRGLPPTYVTVNQIDPLLDEGLAYARRLIDAGVPTELHLWPGAYHGFDMVEAAAISQRAGAALHAALRRGLYGVP